MSGDVQPRKRKEKRRKKDDEDAGTPPPTLVNPAEHVSENVTIHVYKEGSTGGHWCARIIFFALFTVLIGLVGVIIFEHRGTTDVDTPIASSKWAIIFEGWVDDVFPFHDDAKHEKHDEPSHEIDHDEEDEHEEDDHEEDDHEEDEHEDKHEDEEEDEKDDSGIAEDDNNDEEDEDETEDSEGDRIEEDEEEEEEEEEEEDEEVEYDEEDEEEEEAEDDEDNLDQENDMNEDEEVDSKAESDEGFAEDDNDSVGALDDEEEGEEEEGEEEEEEGEEGEEDNEEQNYDDNDDDDEEDITNISAPELDMSIDKIKTLTKKDTDASQYATTGIHDIDDSSEPLEEIEVEKFEQFIHDAELEQFEDEVKQEEEETSVAVKFGVGVALVIAAHFVLVRRWKNVEDVKPQEIDLTRRNTIIPPPNPKQFNVTSSTTQKQQLKNFQDFESKYKNLPSEEIRMPLNKQSGFVGTSKNVLKKEEEMNIRAVRKDEQEIYTSESERFSGTEQESEYDEEDSEDEDFEEEVEEEEEEEEEDEEENEEHVEEIDDHELVAKLEAKYGKLPTPSQSEEEMEDEEIEDDEDMEYDEEERETDVGDWKRLNAPHQQHSSVEDTKNKKTVEVPKTSQTSSRGSRQEFDFIDPGDYNDVNIQEEIEHWLARDLDN